MIRPVFDMLLEARCEIVLDLAAAYALVSAAENLLGSDEMAGRKGFIAGGKAQGCKLRTMNLVEALFPPICASRMSTAGYVLGQGDACWVILGCDGDLPVDREPRVSPAQKHCGEIKSAAA
jgi:hypothetical protein